MIYALISDIFITIKTWIWWITSFESILTEKPEEILSFLTILDKNPNFPPKFFKNLHIQNFN